MDFREAIIHAVRVYPKAEIQDLVKLTCQITLGPAHLIRDADAAVKAVLREAEEAKAAWQSAEASGIPYYRPKSAWEPIGEGYYRAHLNAVEPSDPETVARAFLDTAAHTVLDGKTALLRQRGAILRDFCLDGTLPPDWRGFVEHWLDSDCPLQSHSEAYHTAYHPAYRIIRNLQFAIRN